MCIRDRVGTLALATAIGIPALRAWRGEAPFPTPEAALVLEMRPGMKDPEVLALARGEGALLLTTDEDLGELVFRQGFLGTGVLLLRLEGLPPLAKADRVAWALRKHGVVG